MNDLVWKKALVLVLVSLLFPAETTSAADEPPRGVALGVEVQFNLLNPGARSLALGGAFLGLADDATAAYTNPAGLTILLRPEIAMEGRHFGFSTRYVDSGRAAGTPTGIGMDTIAGIRHGTANDNVTSLSFLSYVYPRKQWSLALYRHVLSNFEAEFQTHGVFATDPLQNTAVSRVINTTDVDLEIANCGIAGAYKLTDTLSVGGGVSYYDFSLDSTTRDYSSADLYGSADFSAGNLVSTRTLDGNDGDFGFNVGFLWRFHERWSLGGVYRQGPEFELDSRTVAGPASEVGDGHVLGADRRKLPVPDVFGVGMAFRPNDALRLTLDYDRVEYSAFTKTVNVQPFDVDPRDFRVDDADELHAGLEYMFIKFKRRLSLRFGAWNNPDHGIRYEGTTTTREGRLASTFFRGRGSDIHYSAGFGLVLAHDFQWNMAVDASERVTSGSMSGVYVF